jgi:hypothetical protein
MYETKACKKENIGIVLRQTLLSYADIMIFSIVEEKLDRQFLT